MELLETFYRQIGALVELEHVQLEIAMDGGDGTDEDQAVDMNYRWSSFPDLLSLPKNGYPGYLSLLVGLIKLEMLRGSFSAKTGETRLGDPS